jgi:hypothetical protein
MKASSYAPQFQSIFDAAGRHADEVEKKQYTSWNEAKRDRAIAIELWQKYADLLEQAMNDEEALIPEKLDMEEWI